MLSDSVTAGGALHRTNQSDLLTEEVRCEMTNWNRTANMPTTAFNVHPRSRQTTQTPLPRPHPVIPSVTLQPHSFMFCQAPSAPFSSHAPLGRLQKSIYVNCQHTSDIKIFKSTYCDSEPGCVMPNLLNLSPLEMVRLYQIYCNIMVLDPCGLRYGSLGFLALIFKLSYFPSCLRVLGEIWASNVLLKRSLLTLLTDSISLARCLFTKVRVLWCWICFV